MKVLDQRENEYLPQVILDTMEVSLASACPLHAICTCISKTLRTDFLLFRAETAASGLWAVFVDHFPVFMLIGFSFSSILNH